MSWILKFHPHSDGLDSEVHHELHDLHQGLNTGLFHHKHGRLLDAGVGLEESVYRNWGALACPPSSLELRCASPSQKPCQKWILGLQVL
uniref:Uncharacterized protein n=1 Tax=Triticum urartu TaxID=4572 RepID=A0A8R7UEI4_TRIUA